MVTERIVLKFPKRVVDQPVICRLVKEYDLEFNILKAYITPQEEGLLVLELKGEEENYRKGVNYLKKTGVQVQLLSSDIVRNDARCTHCGVCISICPTDALVIDSVTRKVNFNNEKCIACELCVTACPVRAMEISF